VQAAINAAGTFLPTNLPMPPVYYKDESGRRADSDARADLDVCLCRVEELAETRMAQRISQLQGVGWSASAAASGRGARAGESDRAGVLRAEHGTLRTALGSANVNAGQRQLRRRGAGLDDQRQRSAQKGAQYAPIIIAYRNGAPVRLSDVATVIDGAEKHQAGGVGEYDPAIILNIQRQPGTNIIGVVNTVRSCCRRSRLRCRNRCICRSSRTAPPRSAPRWKTSNSNWR
jgi:multidrug efflux pump